MNYSETPEQKYNRLRSQSQNELTEEENKFVLDYAMEKCKQTIVDNIEVFKRLKDK